MKKKILVMVLALALGAVSGFGQTRTVQPAPTYYRGTTVQPAPASYSPVYYTPQPTPQGYYAPRPAPQMKLAAEPAYEEDYEEVEEDGIYWFWGSKWPGMALGPKIGTTGIGLDLTFGITRFVNLRSGFNYGSFTWSTGLGDVDYDMDIDLISVPLLVDIHPFANHFRISGGLYIQPGSKAAIEGTPSTATQIGAHVYAPEVIGTITGDIEVSSTITPYLGIGFGNSVGEDQLLTFMVDFGVIFQAYDVSLTSDGAGMTTKLDTFRKDLVLEEENVQSDMDNFKIFPVLTFGITYHF